MTAHDLHHFRRIVFFTGAGMSAESGVPTYRGDGGIWHQYNYQEYACQQAFDQNPVKIWDFHNIRRQKVAGCEPNAGHHLIAQWQKTWNNITVITQNIDGLHQRAGATGVLELHGSLWRVRCDACGIRQASLEHPLTELQHACGAYWRPDIVWFGDMLFSDVIKKTLDAIRNCDLLVSIGTSGVVYPAAEFPLHAKANGATLVEINPQATPMSGEYDICLRGPATQMLPILADKLAEHTTGTAPHKA